MTLSVSEVINNMWDLNKINKIISEQTEECLTMEYKSSGALDKTNKKKEEISKDISAFANSAGGMIIYGISEDKNKRFPERIDPINASEFSKEWLENVITSNIYPKINNLAITSISIPDENDDLVVYVVEIPQSNTAHQAKDFKYYKRYNFKSQPMLDWEIRDVMNRSAISQPVLYFHANNPTSLLSKCLDNVKVEVWISNEGNKVIKYLECYMSGDAETARYINKPKVSGKFEEYFSNNIEHKVRVGENLVTLGFSRQAILPNTSRRIGIIEIRPTFLKSSSVLKFQISTEDNTIFQEYSAEEIFSSFE